MRFIRVVAATTALFAQGSPHLEVGLGRGETDVPALVVSLRDLLSDGRFLRTMQSGFPLYVEYEFKLRESRSSWFDRTRASYRWEFVVLHDPVRESFVVEEEGGTVTLAGEPELDEYLSQVFEIRGLRPEGSGRFYYHVSVEARTLSDEDVDEVFDWLKGDDADSSALRDRGLLTRTARSILVKVAPLPNLTISESSEKFEVP